MSSWTVGTKYAVGVTVTNRYGATDFDGAFLLEVIGYIAPIDPDSFAYADVEMIQGTSFTAGKADGFEGAEVTFSLGELPAALQGRIAIDELTGTVFGRQRQRHPAGRLRDSRQGGQREERGYGRAEVERGRESLLLHLYLLRQHSICPLWSTPANSGARTRRSTRR